MRRTWLRRAAVLAALTALTYGFTASPLPAVSAPGPVVLSNGADVSWLPLLEREGTRFVTDKGKRTDPLLLMSSAGLKVARVRLWVNPANQDSSLDEALALAKRIRAAKLALVLDLHYSDWWADPANQKIPAAWEHLSHAGLVEQVGDYTAQTLGAFVDQGTPPAWVQIGNEIANGMLWPDGALKAWTPAEFSSLADLLNSGTQAARQASPKSRVLIHLETGGDASKTRNWLSMAFAAGLNKPDGVGLSYYSQWSGSFSKLTDALAVVSNEYGLRVAIAETAYPNSASQSPRPLLDPNKSRLPGFALSPSGQAAYATKVAEILRKTAGTRGIGVWWWEAFSPNRLRVKMGSGPSALMFSSLVSQEGAPNAAMKALGRASR
ncbi:MAG: hypothetical protein RL102_311 [Actinomycetota bacterium]